MYRHVDQKIKAFLSDILLRANMFVRPIKTRTLEDYPYLPDMASGGTLEFKDCLVMPGAVGIHDAGGLPIVESYLKRGGSDTPAFPHGEPQSVAIDPDQPLDRLGKAIILPPLGFYHYGQLLTETLGWLSEFLDPDTKLLELIRSGTPLIMMGKTVSLNDSIPGLRKALDIPEDRIILARDLERPIRCDRVFLPQTTLVGSRAMDRKYTQTVFPFMNRWFGINPTELRRRMQNETSGDAPPTAKVYLSRTKLKNDVRKIIGEEGLEKELARCGWTIIHPETLSIEDQILTLYHARVIGGNLGSGFHTLLYLGDQARGKTVIGLGTDNFENDRFSWIYNFVHQFRLQGIRFRHLSCLGFDDSTKEEKLSNILRYYDLKPIYPTRRIIRKMEAIANSALGKKPSETT